MWWGNTNPINFLHIGYAAPAASVMGKKPTPSALVGSPNVPKLSGVSIKRPFETLQRHLKQFLPFLKQGHGTVAPRKNRLARWSDPASCLLSKF
jgi:hypothetical protein